MKTRIFNLITQNNAKPARRIAYSFFMVIFIGALLLMLPISNKNHEVLNFIDALFTATSATCVTGLVSVSVCDQFTLFGQFVIILLIQTGGISFMILMASFLLLLRNKLSIHDKTMIKELLNQSYIKDFKKFIKGILKYTFIIEMIGAFIIFLVLIKNSDSILKTIFDSIFIAVSAFCNAGFDNLYSDSLISLNTSPILLITVMSLIVLGGIGFVVYFDLFENRNLLKKKKFKKYIQVLNVHTKVVLITTFLLIIIPAILFMILEYNHSMRDLSFINKIVNSLFTSITLRTAGFTSIVLSETTLLSQFIMLICMFIGGSPAGTAGGIKTTTFVVILLSIISSLKGKSNISIFKRNISKTTILQATNVLAMNLLALLAGISILCVSENFTFMEIVYEAISALATVGLTLGITTSLSVIGKLVVIMLMYVGRIGIMTFVLSFVKEKSDKTKIQYANGHVIVG